MSLIMGFGPKADKAPLYGKVALETEILFGGPLGWGGVGRGQDGG